MMIGARTAAWAKSGGWVNPYVTDGLVAMWDGEWNAGGGVHDPNATVWKDLSPTGCDLDIDPRATISDKYLSANDVSDVDIYVASSTPKKWFSKEDVVTTECVISLNESGATGHWSDEFHIFCFDGEASVGYCYRGLYAHNYWNSFMFHTSGSSGPGINKRTGKTAYSWAQTGNYDVFSTFVNGVSVSESKKYGDNLRDVGVKIGGKNNRPRYYTIRLYSRELTADEIAANYAVDKARFGLP